MNTNKRITFILLFLLCSVGVSAYSQSDLGLPAPEDQQLKEKLDQGITPESMDPGDFKDLGEPDPIDPFEKSKTTSTPTSEKIDVSSAPEKTAEPAAPAPVVEAATPVKAEDKPSAAVEEKKSKKKTKKKGKASARMIKPERREPDFKKEKFFHSLYKKYAEKPIANDVWETASATKKAEIYKIQKGDNLWSLSKAFFGDSFYWPKIWGLNNDEMYNPHQIDTWMSLRFFQGTLEAPPMMGAVLQRLPEDPTVEIPHPKKKITPLFGNLPDSLPRYRYTQKTPPMTDFSDLRSRAKVSHPPVYLTYFAWDNSLEGSGEVFETELGLKTASDFQYVYLSLDEAPKKKIFSVIKEIGMVKGTEFPLIEVQGEVEVIEVVPNQEGLYKAIVRKTLMPIEVGARLISEPLLTLNVEPTPVKHIAGVRLIGGEFNINRTLLSDKSFVFVDGGRAEGLTQNMTLEIFAEKQVRNPESKIEGARTLIGLVKILKVGEGVSTGYILKQTDEVGVGDPVGERNGDGIVADESVARSAGRDDDDGDSAPAPIEESSPDDAVEELEL